MIFKLQIYRSYFSIPSFVPCPCTVLYFDLHYNYQIWIPIPIRRRSLGSIGCACIESSYRCCCGLFFALLIGFQYVCLLWAKDNDWCSLYQLCLARSLNVVVRRFCEDCIFVNRPQFRRNLSTWQHLFSHLFFTWAGPLLIGIQFESNSFCWECIYCMLYPYRSFLVPESECFNLYAEKYILQLCV